MELAAVETSTANRADISFEPLQIPVRSPVSTHVSRYRVYSSRTQCVTVEAETAAEAFRASGIESPCRIQREVPGGDVLIELNKLLA